MSNHTLSLSLLLFSCSSLSGYAMSVRYSCISSETTGVLHSWNLLTLIYCQWTQWLGTNEELLNRFHLNGDSSSQKNFIQTGLNHVPS